MTSISNESLEQEMDHQQLQQQRYDGIKKNSTNNNTQQQSNESNNGSDEQYNDTTTNNSFYYYYYYYLITDESQYNLITYVYHGEDLSLLYKYVLSPLASFCVNYCTPYWLAPNSITLIGLLLMFISYCSMWYYVPTFTEQYNTNNESDNTSNDNTNNNNTIPLWIYLYNGIAILLYQTLDNMDGKQARRTKSNTSLGLLFDHGCDSINSLFGSVNWIICMKLNPMVTIHDLVLCTIILFGPYGLFYIGTWEEYYTGKLVLPLANGPNEGLLGAACMSFVSYLYSPGYWQTTSTYDTILSLVEQNISSSIVTIPITIKQLQIRNADLLVVASTIGFIQEIFSKLFIVSKRYGIQVCKTLVPFIIWILCYIVIGIVTFEYVDSTTITTTNNESVIYTMIWLQIPRTSLHLCAILFVEMTIDLMLCHLTKQQYTCFRWIQIPLIILTIWILVLYTSIYRSIEQQQHDNDDQQRQLTTTMIQLIEKYYIKDYILAYASASGTYLVFKMTIIIHEICSVLNIWCFDITTPRHRRQLSQPNRNHVKAD